MGEPLKQQVDGLVAAIGQVADFTSGLGQAASCEAILAGLLERVAGLLPADAGCAYLDETHEVQLLGDAGAVGQLLPLPPQILKTEPAHTFMDTDAAGNHRLIGPIRDQADQRLGLVALLRRRGQPPFDQSEISIVDAMITLTLPLLHSMQLRDRLERAHLDLIVRLAAAAEFRDNETGGHIQRVSMYAEALAGQMGLDRVVRQRILFAAPMHDVGKLGVPDAILQKPGALTPTERRSMQYHTLMGAKILGGSVDPLMMTACEIARCHHERWDGGGYPEGWQEDEIPLPARVVAIADVFDALTSARIYKPAMPTEQAFSMIAEQAGGHFDPAATEAFLAARPTIESIHSAYAAMGPLTNQCDLDDLWN